MAVDFETEIKHLRTTMASVREVTDLPALEQQISDLEQQAAAPDLWDDPESAQRVTSALSRANAERDRIVGMDSRIDDLETLVELGTEEGDADTLAEAETELTKVAKAVSELEVRTLLSGEYDEREAVVTIRAGAGGVDAADFAEMLMRMYLRWAERHGYPTKVMDTSYAEEAGLKSATFEVNVPYAYGNLSVEGGTHRLVRISPFDNQGRRQTSFAAVEVIPLIESTDSIDIPDNDLKIDVFRSSGPGGQSVNTTDSAVRITHVPTGLVVSCQDQKSQLQNREQALRILRTRLLDARRAEQEAASSAARRSQVRTVDRSERIRTYNFPESRVADHRTGYKAGNLQQVLSGDLEELIGSARAAELRASRSRRRADLHRRRHHLRDQRRARRAAESIRHRIRHR